MYLYQKDIMRFLQAIFIFVFGFLVAKFIYEEKAENFVNQEVHLILNEVKNLSKLVVAQGNFAEIYSFSDSKKYMYDVLSFDKKAIVSVKAKVEVGYDLSKLSIDIDSIHKKIIIRKIPKEELTIIPELKYFDLQESSFNSFSSKDLNSINQKAIQNIENTSEVLNLKNQAKDRLFVELSKIYQLSKVYKWSVVDATEEQSLIDFKM